jgi:hypothetical protein
MNAQEWYKQIWASNTPLQFASEQLAAKDDLIVTLQEELRLAAAVKLDLAAQRGDLEQQLGESNTVRAQQAMKIVNQRNGIEALERALAEARDDRVEALRKFDAVKKAVELRRIKTKEQQDANDRLVSRIRKIQRRLISAANEPFKYPRGFGQLLEELDDQFFGADFAKGESWTRWGLGKNAYGKMLLDLMYPLHVTKPSAAVNFSTSDDSQQPGPAQVRYTNDVGSAAEFRPQTRIERRAEARRVRGLGLKCPEGTYGADDLKELEIFEQVKRETPECNQGEECSACNTIAAKRFEEWRFARGPTQATSDCGSGSCGESAAENEARETESLAHRIERHDTQFRRTTERFDRHAKKLTELDGSVKKLQEGVTHARLSRGKMHAQIGALESRVKEHADSFATRINYVEGTAFERIVDIHKTAEADRVEFRAADAAVHERISKLAERIGSLEAHRNGRTVG